MSLVLRVYVTNSPTNKIEKDLSVGTSYNINLKNRPKDFNNFDVDFSANNLSALNFNYAYLGGGYNYYYFVKILPTNIGNLHYKLHLELDPLMTYKSQILNLNCIIKRNTNKYNLYVPDDRLPTLKKTQIQTKAFNHTFIPYQSTVITLVGSSYD